jgi:bacterioferritin-associated ferredoxin
MVLSCGRMFVCVCRSVQQRFFRDLINSFKVSHQAQ